MNYFWEGDGVFEAETSLGEFTADVLSSDGGEYFRAALNEEQELEGFSYVYAAEDGEHAILCHRLDGKKYHVTRIDDSQRATKHTINWGDGYLATEGVHEFEDVYSLEDEESFVDAVAAEIDKIHDNYYLLRTAFNELADNGVDSDAIYGQIQKFILEATGTHVTSNDDLEDTIASRFDDIHSHIDELEEAGVTKPYSTLIEEKFVDVDEYTAEGLNNYLHNRPAEDGALGETDAAEVSQAETA